MPFKKADLKHSYRIALVIDGFSLIGHRLMSGVCQRATAYPLLLVRRYFIETMITDGIDQLVDWKPDALIVNCSDTPLLEKLRKSQPSIPIIAMNAISLDKVDAIVKGNANEVISLSLNHFFNNGLNNIALFYTGIAEAAHAQTDVFHQLLDGHSGTFNSFLHDIEIETLLGNPSGESLEKTGAWLKTLPKPVGIYSPTCHSAAYLVRVCNHFGLAIPEEIQIIGCDELDESLECIPHLSSIHLPSERIGAAALKTTINLLHGEKPSPKTLLVDGSSLIPQGSTGIIPSRLSDIPAAIAYIESHAIRGATVDDVLNQTQSVSRMTFYREFNEQTGTSPARYIKRIRIETACHLLSTTQMEITRVAELSGFAGSNYFAQAFRRDTGMTPNQYRKSH